MQLVANLGFPAIVTMYLLVRIEGKLENLSIGINSLNSSKFEDGKKINLINSICKYYDYECNVYVDDDVDVDDVEFGMADIEIECYLSKVESLVVIFKVFDIYIDMVDYMDYNY